MPFEDHILKQVERFGQAIARALGSILGSKSSSSLDPVITVNDLLQAELDLTIDGIHNFSERELIDWFSRPPFNKLTRDAFIELLFTEYCLSPQPNVKELIKRLILASDSIQSSVSMKRIEWIDALKESV